MNLKYFFIFLSFISLNVIAMDNPNVDAVTTRSAIPTELDEKDGKEQIVDPVESKGKPKPHQHKNKNCCNCNCSNRVQLAIVALVSSTVSSLITLLGQYLKCTR